MDNNLPQLLGCAQSDTESRSEGRAGTKALLRVRLPGPCPPANGLGLFTRDIGCAVSWMGQCLRFVGARKAIAQVLSCASWTIHRFLVEGAGLWLRTEVVWWGFLGFGPWFCCALIRFVVAPSSIRVNIVAHQCN
jgi:hypothetical protein